MVLLDFKRWCSVVGVGLALGGQPLLATPVRLQLAAGADGSSLELNGQVVAVHAAAASKSAAGETVLVLANGRGQADLAPGAWRLTPQVEGYWGAEVLLDVDGAKPLGVSLPVWPLRQTETVLLPAPQTSLPREMRAVFESPRDRQQEVRVSRTETTCRVEHDRARCRLPATVLNVEMRLKGHVPTYYWGLDLRPDRVHALGRMALRRGASISGFVEPPVARARVSLLTSTGEAIVTDDQSGGRGKAFTVPIDKRGFFQIADVPPGTYRIIAASSGMAGRSLPLQVLEGTESRFKRPLRLLPASSLEVTLDPPRDPWDEPWRVALYSVTYGSGEMAVPPTQAAQDGRWYVKGVGLSEGPYLLVVSASNGDPWLRYSTDLHPDPDPLSLTLPVLRIQGRVLSAGEGLQARLTFKKGNQRASTFQADENGEFQGFLPQEGSETRTWDVAVHADDPPIRRSALRVEVEPSPVHDGAYVEISVNGGTLKGRLVTEDGEPYSGLAFVDAEHTSGPEVAQTALAAEDHGVFEFRGLPAGRYNVSARTPGLVADPVMASVEVNSEKEVTVTLRDRLKIVGRVVTPEGTPVPGARVVGVPAQTPMSAFGARPADAEGRFVLRNAPVGTRELGLYVWARGFVFKLARVAVPPAEGLLLVPMERHGGRIELTSAPNAIGGERTFLFHDGYYIDAHYLSRIWGRLFLETGSEEPSTLVLPEMSPGSYVACRAFARQVPGLLSSPAARRGCPGGDLAPGATLTLELAESEAGSRGSTALQ